MLEFVSLSQAERQLNGDSRHNGHSAVSHLVRLLERARLAGDAALYVDLQAQLARELSA